jgi:hypothetical protein
MAYRLRLGEDYTFPESLTYNLFSFRSSVPSAKLPRAHGARVPPGFLAERRIEIRGLLETGWATDVPLQTQIDGLRAAVMAGPQTLYLPNDRHLRNVQKDDNGQDRYENTYPERIVEVTLDLITGDPFMYNDTESSDLNNAVDQTPEDVVINNDDGNAPAAPELRLTVSGGGGLDAILATANKGATEFTYSSGGTEYNYIVGKGDVMAVVFDQFGGLGVTPIVSFIPSSKPPGIADSSTGVVDADNIGTNGQLLPDGNPPSYAIMRSLESTNGLVSTELGIESMVELVTVAGGKVIAGWGVRGDSTDLRGLPGGDRFIGPTDAILNDFVASGANAGGALSAETDVSFMDIDTGSGTNEVLQVVLNWSFQNAASVLEKTRLKCRVEMTNKTGSTLTNVRFAFALDPNTSFTSGNDDFRFFPAADDTAFAVAGGYKTGCELGLGHCHYVGLGVYTSGPNVNGTKVGWGNSVASELLATKSPEAGLNTRHYLKLGSGTNAQYYNTGSLSTSTTNFQTDTAWRNALPTDTGDRVMYIISPNLSIAASDTEEFEFYIFTRTDLQGGDVDLDATVENITTGESFTLQGTVPDGTEIRVNSLDETVLIGDDDRTDLFDGLFPLLALGNNTIRITEPNEVISNLDVYWRNRWY